MYFINSKINDVFYFRLLFANKKNYISYKNLIIVFVQIKNVEKKIIESQFIINFKNVCIVLNFTNNDNE